MCSEDAGCGANGPRAGAGYTPLPSTVDTALHTVTTNGVTGKATTKTLRGCGELGKCVDVDKLRLHCLPASRAVRDVTARARDPRPEFSWPPPRGRPSTR